MNNSTILSTVCNKNPQNFDLHLRGAHDLFPQVHYLLFIFFTKNLLINSLETSESQMIAAGSHYSVVLYKDAVWACCTPLIVYVFQLELLDCYTAVLVAEKLLLEVNGFSQTQQTCLIIHSSR